MNCKILKIICQYKYKFVCIKYIKLKMFKLCFNDCIDKYEMLSASDLLMKRLHEIQIGKAKNDEVQEPPSLAEIEKNHILFKNEDFKPFDEDEKKD